MAVTTFQTTLSDQLSAVDGQCATPSDLPLEVWAMDESRFGLHTVHRRRITVRGVQPVGRYQHDFDNFYVYGAVARRTGDGYFEAHLSLNAPTFQTFLNQFAAERPQPFNVLILDHAGVHHAKALTLPANVALIFQPPYTPEVNPTERAWRQIKDGLAWRCFDDLLALQEALVPIIEGLDTDTLRSLIAYPYLVEAIDARAA
ncbi:MAG: IS630 family transposase [Anaerolineae bacterium]|nr:IS630 family transposase [Anaerolineae bacterium]